MRAAQRQSTMARHRLKWTPCGRQRRARSSSNSSRFHNFSCVSRRERRATYVRMTTGQQATEEDRGASYGIILLRLLLRRLLLGRCQPHLLWCLATSWSTQWISARVSLTRGSTYIPGCRDSRRRQSKSRISSDASLAARESAFLIGPDTGSNHEYDLLTNVVLPSSNRIPNERVVRCA